MHTFKAVVEVAGFEMMRYTGELRPASIGHIWVDRVESNYGFPELGRIGVVENHNAKSVLRIVEIAGGPRGIHDEIDVFAATSDENIYRRHIISYQAQFGPYSFFEDEDHPEHLEEGWDGDGNLNCNKDPSHRECLALLSLRGNDEEYPENEIQPVRSECRKGEEWNGVVDVALPVGPLVFVIPAVEFRDVALLDPFSIEELGTIIWE